ncbi:glycerophosphodiester phosphodiesterase [Leekyejoonella antrihumi]|uniref:Glycerophosphodiester phosphodiesterase n=2 Tax=Leekyejoonella antrihumi TaxID=1660198 RepID=A0A563DTU3_9MICO|nr:glycerophosphodiester phosphodiesterase [Leekyejoonella antrihumi]
MAHRGFSGPDGNHRIENSMRAFQAAVDLGLMYVETDVHATADGVLLAFHDETLDRVTDSRGVISGLPWSQVSRAKIGGQEPIPRLEDLLARWPDLRINIDVKSAHAIAPTVELIDRMQAHDRVCIASFSDTRRRAVVRRLARPVAVSAGQGTIARFVVGGQWLPRALDSVLGATGRAGTPLHGIDCLQVPERAGRLTVVTPHFLRAAHRLGVQVHVWTPNDVPSMHRLLDLGVDGIITDRADLLKQVLRQRGQWPSPPNPLV